MSHFDSMLIALDQSSTQEQCPIIQTQLSPAIIFIQEVATFLDTLAMKTSVCMQING